MKSDPIPVSCPYTLRVAGPVKPIPNDAPFLPIRVGRSCMSLLNLPVNRLYLQELVKLKADRAKRDLLNELFKHQILHPTTRVMVHRSLLCDCD